MSDELTFKSPSQLLSISFPAGCFTTSPETDKLDAAMAKVQGEVDNAIKNKVNPHFKSKYADLAAVWEACREALAKNQIALMQFPVHSTDGRLHLMTRVAHGGQWILSQYSIPVGKNDAHGFGSALTYIKRQALKAVVGVADEEDDDGNKSLAPPSRPPQAAQSRPQQPQAAPQTQKPVTAPRYGVSPAEDWVIPSKFKKFAGKRLGDCELRGRDGLESYVSWLDNEAKKHGKKLEGDAEEFFQAVQFLLMEDQERVSGFAQMPDPWDLPPGAAPHT